MENSFEGRSETGNTEKILKDKLLKFVNIEDFDLFSKIQERIVDFADRLRKKYPDFQDYSFYHLLAGSTLRGECPKKDFPGDDSVERFINLLE